MGLTFKESVDLCNEGVPVPGAIYRDNPNLGLAASMVKWHRICNDLDPIVGALDLCGLCHSYLPNCADCGLGSRSSRCNSAQKPFARVTTFFKSNISLPVGTMLSSLDESDLVHYIEMYESVRDLCTQEQLAYFDSVFE